MDQAYFRAFAERCRDLMQRARSEAARDQLYLWAEEFDARADGSEEGGGGPRAADQLEPTRTAGCAVPGSPLPEASG